MKLAVTLTMPWPLPCRGSLLLRLALVLSSSQCWLSLAAGSTKRLSSERAKCLCTSHTPKNKERALYDSNVFLTFYDFYK